MVVWVGKGQTDLGSFSPSWYKCQFRVSLWCVILSVKCPQPWFTLWLPQFVQPSPRQAQPSPSNPTALGLPTLGEAQGVPPQDRQSYTLQSISQKTVNAFGVISALQRSSPSMEAWIFFPLLLFYTWGGFFSSMHIHDRELVGLNY